MYRKLIAIILSLLIALPAPLFASQNDYNITTSEANTGTTFRAAVNSALQALASSNSGDSAPTTTYAGMIWYDTLNGKLKVRNAANSAWLELWDFSTTFSAFMYTLVDDTTAAAARTTLGIPIISAKDYCHIDGTTDDTAHLQAAVTAAEGGILYVPAGNYLLKLQTGPANASIKIKSNTTILMDPKAYILSEGSAAGVDAYADRTGLTAVFTNDDQSTGNSNITIVGGAFKKATGFDGGVFMAFKNVTGLNVINTRLLDTDASCRFQIAYCTYVYLRGLKVDYEDSHSSAYSYEDGIRIDSGCSYVVVSDCNIVSGDDAIALNNEPSANWHKADSKVGGDITHVTITNCNLQTHAGTGIRIYQESTMTAGVTKRIVISNITGVISHPSGTNDALSIADYSGRTAIQDVKVSDVYLNCHDVDNAGVIIVDATDIDLTNITIDDYNVYGIAVSGGHNVTITNPYIKSTQSTADGIIIASSSSNVKVIGGNIFDSYRDGVRIDGSNDCAVIGTYIETTSAGYGIYLTGSALRTRIIGNRIYDVASGGIFENTGVDYTVARGNQTSGELVEYDIALAGSNSDYDVLMIGSYSYAVADTEQTSKHSTSYVKGKEITIYKAGTVTVAADIKCVTDPSRTVYIKFYKNDVAYSAELNSSSTTYATKSANMNVSPGDKVQMYYKTQQEDGLWDISYKNFRIKVGPRILNSYDVGLD